MKSVSAKKAMTDMIFYYQYALLQEGCENPIEVIIDSINEAIQATEEQLEQLKLCLLQGNKFIENLDSSILLLKGIEESNKLDLESIRIVRSILELSKEMSSETLKHVIEKTETND